jgi:hypothetical protein
MRLELIEYIITQVTQIQGELILNKAMLSGYDEKIEEAFERGDILAELLAIKDQVEVRNQFLTKINYLEGKVDCYMEMLKKIEP